MISKAVWNWLMKATPEDIEELRELLVDIENLKQAKIMLALKYGMEL